MQVVRCQMQDVACRCWCRVDVEADVDVDVDVHRGCGCGCRVHLQTRERTAQRVGRGARLVDGGGEAQVARVGGRERGEGERRRLDHRVGMGLPPVQVQWLVLLKQLLLLLVLRAGVHILAALVAAGRSRRAVRRLRRPLVPLLHLVRRRARAPQLCLSRAAPLLVLAQHRKLGRPVADAVRRPLLTGVRWLVADPAVALRARLTRLGLVVAVEGADDAVEARVWRGSQGIVASHAGDLDVVVAVRREGHYLALTRARAPPGAPGSWRRPEQTSSSEREAGEKTAAYFAIVAN